MLTGTGASIGMWAWVKADPTALHFMRFRPAKDMAEKHVPRFVVVDGVHIVTVAVSYMTKPKPVSELKGLVYGETENHPNSVATDVETAFWAWVVAAVFVVLNVIFWKESFMTVAKGQISIWFFIG